MLEDVTARLASFGYIVTGADSWMLNFIIQKVENYILSSCNLTTIPDGLYNIGVDMAVGEFLLNKKAVDQLVGFDLSAAVKSIQEGDTNIGFSGEKSPEQRIDELIGYLINGRKNELVNYRGLAW